MDTHAEDDAGSTPELASFLGRCPPFDALDAAQLEQAARAAHTMRYRPGELVIDAFAEATKEIFLVVDGVVDLWTRPDQIGAGPDTQLSTGHLFGFSAMLTDRAVGPRAAAHTALTVARIPADVAAPAFSSGEGARFLAERTTPTDHRDSAPPTYSMVNDLVVSPPLVLDPAASVADAARQMSERGLPCAIVEIGDGRYGLVSDAVLRRRILAPGLPSDTPVRAVMDFPAHTVAHEASAAEALIELLDSGADFLLVTDRTGALRGVVAAQDFVVSPTTAGVSLHEQIRRATTVDELVERTRRVPAMLDDVLHRGLASSRVIAVYSAIVDTIVRRSIGLVFAGHPELSVDMFTWLSLGSNGRREATLGSDVDAAVAFDDSVTDSEIARYRTVFSEVNVVLGEAGLSIDTNGATAARKPFSRRNSQWRSAAARWLATPEQNKGAIMTSLLVDGRPIHGDPGLPEVARVFSDLRRHPDTMRVLFYESLARRARLRSIRDVLKGRGGTFDIKGYALLPVVNIARWAALGAGSTELHTAARLRAGAGTELLPTAYAERLVEAFEELQRMRLRYQLEQWHQGEPPTDTLERDRLSPIDRRIIAEAVREIAAVQRRMDAVAGVIPTHDWRGPHTAGPAPKQRT